MCECAGGDHDYSYTLGQQNVGTVGSGGRQGRKLIRDDYSSSHWRQIMCTADSEEWDEGDLIVPLGLRWAAVIYCFNKFHPPIPTVTRGSGNQGAGRDLWIHLDHTKCRDPLLFKLSANSSFVSKNKRVSSVPLHFLYNVGKATSC